jgi:hypothetical protein
MPRHQFRLPERRTSERPERRSVLSQHLREPGLFRLDTRREPTRVPARSAPRRAQHPVMRRWPCRPGERRAQRTASPARRARAVRRPAPAAHAAVACTAPGAMPGRSGRRRPGHGRREVSPRIPRQSRCLISPEEEGRFGRCQGHGPECRRPPRRTARRWSWPRERPRRNGERAIAAAIGAVAAVCHLGVSTCAVGSGGCPACWPAVPRPTAWQAAGAGRPCNPPCPGTALGRLLRRSRFRAPAARAEVEHRGEHGRRTNCQPRGRVNRRQSKLRSRACRASMR